MRVHRYKPRVFHGPEAGLLGMLAPRPGTRSPGFGMSTEERHNKDVRTAMEMHTRNIVGKHNMRAHRDSILRGIRHEVLAHWRLTDIALEKRRQHLRELFQVEDTEYMRGVHESGDTIEERVNRMREKVKLLRHNRAVERALVSKEKYDQQFWENSEELRTRLSKNGELACAYDLQKQMEMKREWTHDGRAEDAFLQKMWQDKCEREIQQEEKEKRDQKERNIALQTVQLQQIREKEQEKVELQNLKAYEKEQRIEAERLDDLRKQRELEEKYAKHQAAKKIYEANIQLKSDRLAQEKVIERQIDDLYTKEILESLQKSDAEAQRKKIQLAEECRMYMAYQEKLRELEAEEDKMRDEIVRAAEKEENKKRWEEQWKLQQKRLQFNTEMNEALAESEKKKAEIRLARFAEIDKQRAAILADMAHLRQQMEAEHEARMKVAREHENALKQQIHYNQCLRATEAMEKERERAKLREAQEEYQRRMESMLTAHWENPRMHPWRRKAMADGTLKIPANPLEYSSIYYEPPAHQRK